MVSLLAQTIANAVSEALAKRPRAAAAFSGGSSPGALLAHLADQKLAWNRVVVTPTDERCVPLDHRDRNERQLRELLAEPTGARCVALWPVETEADADGTAGRSTAELLGDVRRRIATELLLPFDVVVAGFGLDGHTASLFPATPDLAAALDPAGPAELVLGGRGPEGHERVSWTVRALADARRLVVLGFGEDKAELLQRALGSGPTAGFPLRALLRAGQGEIWWAP